MILKAREQELKSITRYKQNTVCKPMYYTPNLWIHVQRVTWLTESICKQLNISPEITERVIRVAMFHDDSEIIAWDVATPVKQNWSSEEKSAYEKKCENAIPVLVDNYWNKLWDDYGNILIEVENYSYIWGEETTDLIHAILEYADKLDALMEVTHELYSGSNSFLNHMGKKFGFDLNCFQYVINRVDRRKKKIENILWRQIQNIWYFNIQQQANLDLEKIVQDWDLHTQESCKKLTWNELYDLWKQLHFNSKDSQYIQYLYNQNITR